MDIVLEGFPGPLRSPDDGVWDTDGGGLAGTAGPATDLFIDPASGEATLNAPRLLVAPRGGDFQLMARVDVDFRATYDAGVLLLWADDHIWAKLCFEFSPRRRPMVVSVVTRGVSDDANGFSVEGSSVWLRVSRLNGAYAFHAHTDGTGWHLVRHFSLGDAAPEVGFEVQSPMGEGCAATFAEIAFRPDPLTNLRDGS